MGQTQIKADLTVAKPHSSNSAQKCTELKLKLNQAFLSLSSGEEEARPMSSRLPVPKYVQLKDCGKTSLKRRDATAKRALLLKQPSRSANIKIELDDKQS